MRIYRQEDGRILYELDLPEFRLDASRVEFLYDCFRKAKETKRADEAIYFELMKARAPEIAEDELRRLARLLDRWTRWGIFEPPSRDHHLTNIRVPAPPELQPVTVDHEAYGECATSIYLSTNELLSFAESLAMKEGRTFDEFHPHLETRIPELGLRFTAGRFPAIPIRSVEVEAHRG